MAGYTRNDTLNNIADGNVISAADLDGEFDAIDAAFDEATGHVHDGTANNGAPITKVGPAQDLVVSTGAVTPKTDNAVDLGTSSFEFKDLYIDGTANIDSLVADTADINAGTIDGVTLGTNSAVTQAQIDNININGNAIITTDTNGNLALTPNGTGEVDISKVDIDSGTIDGTTIGGASAAAGTFTNLTASGTVNFTGATVSNGGTFTTIDINGGSIDGVTIGTNSAVTDLRVDNLQLNGNTISSTDTNGNIAITPNGTGEVDISKVDIDSGAIDGTTIGGASAAAGTFTNLTATGTVTIPDNAISGDKVEGGTINATTITTLTSTTGNITNVNATTVDATNIEVTNIKAKDGTAAGSIANSTGVVTLASSVLTTTDINGGTIDGAVIGGASAAAGSFTTLGASSTATFAAGAVGTPAITTTGDTNTGIFFPAADTIAFAEGGAEAMRIDSSGRLGIGTSTPSVGLLQVKVGTDQNFSVRSLSSETAIEAFNDAANANVPLRYVASEHKFQSGTTERMRIDSSGNVGIGAVGAGTSSATPINLNLGSTFASTAGDALKTKLRVFQDNSNNIYGFGVSSGLLESHVPSSAGYAWYINNTERMRITSAGTLILNQGQIQFPATQVASSGANTLDDYEEGTFTPTIVGTTAAGAGTYTTQVGFYTKIGNRVLFTLYLVWTEHTGTGNLRISALPFTASSTANSFHTVSIWNSNIALTAGNLIQAYVNVNSANINLEQYPTGGGAAATIPMDTAGLIIATGHYFV
jgi:hypothetical protein